MKLYSVAFAADDTDDLLHVFFAKLLALCLHHNPNQRFGAGLPYQNSAGVSQLGSHFGNGGLDVGVVLGGGFVGDPDVFQHLGIDGEALAQLA